MADGLPAPIGHRCQIEDSEVQYDGRTPLCPGVSPILCRGGSHLARSRTSVRGALSKGAGSARALSPAAAQAGGAMDRVLLPQPL